MREQDILHENRDIWVGREARDVFTVYVTGITHSKADSSYDDLSLAVARCDYLAASKGAYKSFRLPEYTR